MIYHEENIQPAKQQGVADHFSSHRYGREIDAHDMVMRINGAPSGNFVGGSRNRNG